MHDRLTPEITAGRPAVASLRARASVHANLDLQRATRPIARKIAARQRRV